MTTGDRIEASTEEALERLFKPAYLTERPEGAGLRELIAHLMTLAKR